LTLARIAEFAVDTGQVSSRRLGYLCLVPLGRDLHAPLDPVMKINLANVLFRMRESLIDDLLGQLNDCFISSEWRG
jgi:hypothetical protein